jgi:hypothetical protein
VKSGKSSLIIGLLGPKTAAIQAVAGTGRTPVLGESFQNSRREFDRSRLTFSEFP